MRLLYLFILLLAPVTACLAADSHCVKLDAEIKKQGYAGAAYEGKVVGKGRTYFHTAPDAKCVARDIFVIPGDFLTVYTESDGWLHVMFLNKDGDDFTGWVREERVEILGSYGRN